MTQIAKTSTSDDPDQQVPIKNVAQWTDSNRTIHKEEEIIRGYVYGGKAIPVSGITPLRFNYASNSDFPCLSISVTIFYYLYANFILLSYHVLCFVRTFFLLFPIFTVYTKGSFLPSLSC